MEIVYLCSYREPETLFTMEYFATAGGITVHLCDSEDHPGRGAGKPAIVLLHGYLETLYIWSEFAAKLEKHYRVIVLDLPGHGLTDSAPGGPDGQSVNTMEFCAEVVRDVLDKCLVDKAFIGGHSLGGYIALMCCNLYPDRFEKLILFNSTPFADLPEKSEDRKREIGVIRAGKLETLAAYSIPRMYHPDQLRAHDDKIRETLELCETHFPEGIVASILGMMVRPSQEEWLKQTSIPVMMFGGDQDPFIPIEVFNKMKTLFPKVQFVLQPGTGHLSFIEEETKTSEAVCLFLENNRVDN